MPRDNLTSLPSYWCLQLSGISCWSWSL